MEGIGFHFWIQTVCVCFVFPYSIDVRHDGVCVGCDFSDLCCCPFNRLKPPFNFINTEYFLAFLVSRSPFRTYSRSALNGIKVAEGCFSLHSFVFSCEVRKAKKRLLFHSVKRLWSNCPRYSVHML